MKFKSYEDQLIELINARKFKKRMPSKTTFEVTPCEEVPPRLIPGTKIRSTSQLITLELDFDQIIVEFEFYVAFTWIVGRSATYLDPEEPNEIYSFEIEDFSFIHISDPENDFEYTISGEEERRFKEVIEEIIEIQF